MSEKFRIIEGETWIAVKCQIQFELALKKYRDVIYWLFKGKKPTCGIFRTMWTTCWLTSIIEMRLTIDCRIDPSLRAIMHQPSRACMETRFKVMWRESKTKEITLYMHGLLLNIECKKAITIREIQNKPIFINKCCIISSSNVWTCLSRIWYLSGNYQKTVFKFQCIGHYLSLKKLKTILR